MEGLENSWFETKFVNPRTVEGEPQTERIEYAKEFFETLGNEDIRFSGASLVGSTMKGVGYDESSDIDAAIFYNEKPKKELLPEREFFGIKHPAEKALVYSFEDDFLKFKMKFEKNKIDEGKKIFEIDSRPAMMDLGFYFKKSFFGKTKIDPEDMSGIAQMFYELSYSIIETNNPKAIMPISNVVEAMRKVVADADNEMMATIIGNIFSFATPFINTEYNKYSMRVTDPVNKEVYVNSRLNMLKQTLQNKFGLSLRKD
ncbi:MAG: nucleotidyltransferase domain-containing protein [Candidatus Paceibacterota bacterium]